MKKTALVLALLITLAIPTACTSPAKKTESETILIAAAASLEKSFKDELIPMFVEKNPGITVQGTYDASGKLQTQLEEGLEADVFVSAAVKNMDALTKSGKIDADSVVSLLENRIVLIVPANSNLEIAAFEDVVKAGKIAVGDPESVPAGQYAKEALENLGIWDSVSDRLSLGTNVTEVLAWVSEGSADAGFVYSTDAASTDKVRVTAEAPDGSLKTKIIYPAGVVSASKKKDAAKLFMSFLTSGEAVAVFEKYGFSAVK